MSKNVHVQVPKLGTGTPYGAVKHRGGCEMPSKKQIIF